MAKKDADHAYDINKLNMFFAISSIIMFAFFAWMLWQDFNRDWKRVQAQFRRLEKARTASLIQKEEATLQGNPEYAKVSQDLEAAKAEQKQQQAEYEKAQKDQKDIQGKWYKADQAFRFKKAEYEANRYDYEEAVAEHPKSAAKKKEKLDKSFNAMQDLQLKLDKVNGDKSAIDANVEKYTKRIDDLEKEKTKLQTKLDRMERKEENFSASPANIFRNLPLVDFIGPSIKIQQVVVDNIYEDINFTRIQRVDRCMTCHASIDQEGYKEGDEIPNYGKIEQPFVSHPKLDIFVGQTSKHPMDQFGCTSCHLGRGRSTDFVGAVHVPDSEEEKKRWEKDHDWHKMHHWEYPMYPKSMVEASCIKCHQGVAQIPGGEKINVARYLFIENGCHGCHLTKGFENLPKVGPDLHHISSKVTKEWAFKWIKNPKAFRPTTRMPRYFGNSNNSDPEDVARNEVEIRSMVEYLFAKAEPIDYEPITLSGDPANGKTLVHDLGCVGCHLAEGDKPSGINTRRRFGPPLVKFGSKTNATWLFNWLKEPRNYAPQTRMPNMKLSDQEAMDIAAYLLSIRDTAWEEQKVPTLQEKYLKDEIVFHLKRQYGIAAEEQYNKMSEQERWMFLGEKSISRYGCSGCHLIPGFETAKGIGTSLSEEGSKKVTKFDFGFVDIEHEVPDYITQKLHDPRSFDHERVKRWDEKLIMPNFDFSNEETASLTMLIMGLTNERVPAESQAVLNDSQQVSERGRWLVLEKNCVACHNIDGWGGEIREVITEEGMAPPLLIEEGDKAQSDWLFQFLKAPGKIRPWLKVRMPNFRLTDEEANTLVQFFMAATKNGPFNSPPDITNHLAEGEHIFKTFQCSVCHVIQGVVPPNRAAADLAPDLSMARTRLRASWILKWLEDPQKLQPGTRMPDFFPEAAIPGVLNGDPNLQKEAIRNYIYSLGQGNLASILSPAEAAWYEPKKAHTTTDTAAQPGGTK
jgi:mono/diheme cytochrome c family protein